MERPSPFSLKKSDLPWVVLSLLVLVPCLHYPYIHITKMTDFSLQTDWKVLSAMPCQEPARCLRVDDQVLAIGPITYEKYLADRTLEILAPFEKDGLKGAAVLVTASGFGKMVNVLILTNTDSFEKDIAAFLSSVSLKKPAVPPPPQSPVNRNGAPSLTDNFWKQGAIRGGMLGHSGLATGTFAKTYQFFSNGTYKFYREDMQLAAPKYYLENEEGTYTVSGNTLTITPKKSSFSQHRLKKEDPPSAAGKLPLTTAQYRFEFWLYDGNWRLLLSPIDGNETKRDGTFSFYRNGEAQRTYQYQLVDASGRLIQ